MIRLIELFAGVGSQAMALRNIGAEFEHYRVVEFDKYAIKSYNAIHGTDFQVTDIRDVHGEDLGIVDTDKYDYWLTYSFPCQDLSIGGKQRGMSKGSGTRSGLLWEVERLLNECNELPQVLVMENVQQVHSKRNSEDFVSWINFLQSKGYISYWEDLNAKDFGIPQNRKRCFMVSLLGGKFYRFPEPFPLELRLKDLLEPNVDESFYIKQSRADSIFQAIGTPEFSQRDNVAGTIYANMTLNEKFTRGVFPLCRTLKAENSDVAVVVREATTKGYAKAVEGDSINLEQPNSKTRRGRVGHGVAQTLTTSPQQAVVERTLPINDINGCCKTIRTSGHGSLDRHSFDRHSFDLIAEPQLLRVGDVNLGNNESNNRVYSPEGLSPTLNTMQGGHRQPKIAEDIRIRKLTPLECWRLMGFTDEDFYKAQAVNSNTQLYKQAGNSIVVNVLEAIFKNILED